MNTDKGYTKIPNKIIEAAVRSNFSALEWTALIYVARKTYGWNKESDTISVRKMAKDTGRDSRAMQRAVSKLEKAKVFMAVTPSGIVIEVSDVHPSKAYCPMLVTLLGIAIEAMCFLPRNAFGDIAVIPSGIMVLSLPASKVFVLVMMMALQLLRLS